MGDGFPNCLNWHEEIWNSCMLHGFHGGMLKWPIPWDEMCIGPQSSSYGYHGRTSHVTWDILSNVRVSQLCKQGSQGWGKVRLAYVMLWWQYCSLHSCSLVWFNIFSPSVHYRPKTCITRTVLPSQHRQRKKKQAVHFVLPCNKVLGKALGQGQSQNKGPMQGKSDATLYSENALPWGRGFTVHKAQLLNILNLKSSGKACLLLWVTTQSYYLQPSNFEKALWRNPKP